MDIELRSSRVDEDEAERHRLRAIFGSAVDFAIVATDREGRVTDWNTGADRILGWTAGEMRGETVDRFFTPEDREAGRPQEEMRLALRNGRANDERWHMRKDGSRFWAAGEMMPIRDDAGDHIGWVKILRDFTGRLQERRHTDRLQFGLATLGDRLRAIDATDEMIRAAEEVIGTALDVKRVGYGAVNEDGETFVVPQDWTADGFPSLAGSYRLSDYGRYADDLRQGRTVVIADVTTDPRTSHDLGPLQAVSVGSLINHPVVEREQTVAILYVNDPEPRTWRGDEVAFVRDAAERLRQAVERRQAEQRLAEEAARQRLLLQQMPGFVALLSGPEHVYEYVNDAYVKIASARDLIGRTVRAAFPELAGQGFYELLDHVYTSGNSFDARSIPIRFAGEDSDRFIDLLYEPIRDAAGTVTGIFVGGYDVTEQVRSQAALASSEERYRTLLESVDVGFCIVEMKFDERGKAVDYLLVEGNPAFERQTGLVGKFGKWVSEVAPGLEQHWFDTYGRVALTGEPVHFENEAAIFDRYYDVRALRVGDPARHRVAIVFTDISERRRMEAALRESEEQFRVFAQAVPNHLWASRPDGRFYWFNDQVYAYSGETRERLEGEGWTRIVHPSDLPAASAAWAHSVGSGEVFETEFRIRHADGAYRWFLVRAEPVRGPGGEIVNWIGTNTDVHERKLAETESARDRDRLWTLTRDFLLVCDFAGTITTVNPSATRILGWVESEMVGRSVADFIHPEDMASTTAELGKLSQGATTLAFENRYLTKDGAYRLLDWTAVPEQGRVHAIGRDITVERAAARERERTWALSPTLKMVVSPEGTLLTINPGFTRTLGWEPKEVLGHPVADLLTPEDRATSPARRASLVAGEALPDYQVTMLAKDGSQRRISWTTVVENGVIYAFGRDVTVELEQAEALAKSQEALRQSQKMEAVGQLTGGLAHDFNNLLAGITGSLELLGRRIGQGRINDAERYVTAAQGAAKRAAALTHRLLAFSRRQTLDPKSTDINRLVAGMDDLVRRTVGPEIQLDVVASDDLWLTLVDPNQLENALLNLSINARDAMPGGGKLMIETANRRLDKRAAEDLDVPPGQYVSLCVTDNGTGMPKEVIAKAFDPFFTTKPLGQGTGLGLSMIYGFARQSGGQVHIYSEEGQGTTVCLYLPRHQGKSEADEITPELVDAPRAEAGETVLIVDDEPTVRMLVTEVLEELGYAAIEAADGVSGLKVLQSDVRIDLLVSDVGLPGGMNGRQMADAARVSRPDLKVLFITGYAENAVVGHGHLDPGMHVMTKPFALEALASRINELISSPG